MDPFEQFQTDRAIAGSALYDAVRRALHGPYLAGIAGAHAELSDAAQAYERAIRDADRAYLAATAAKVREAAE